MRRIIERVVTVMTTTTWKISWESDPPPSQGTEEPVPQTLPSSDIPSGIAQSIPLTLETKEVRPSVPERNDTDPVETLSDTSQERK